LWDIPGKGEEEKVVTLKRGYTIPDKSERGLMTSTKGDNN